MNIIKKLFGTKEKDNKSYDHFWTWFQKKEKDFYNVVYENRDIEKNFFNKLSTKLDEIHKELFYMTGMYDEKTVELVITADGAVKNIVFVEELIASAPEIIGWKFSALKPPLNIMDVNIDMDGYQFTPEKLKFYSKDNINYPDEISIVVTHNELNEDNRTTVTNGTFIFLDNLLGELTLVSSLDCVQVICESDAEQELIPINKLKDYLVWRQKEFIEKYEGSRHNTLNDTYSVLEAKLENGNPLVAVINRDLLEWDRKASHPWILQIDIVYNGQENNGLPDLGTRLLLDKIENQIMTNLKDFDGFLNIGRQTAENKREIYFACKDFRKPSKVLNEFQNLNPNILYLTFEIYKDKYWKSFNRFS